ncbi:Flap endonuclease Xni [uncultured archaeon]|nr:Flap endonuclease Xni [uncultured archaeon]
MKKFLLVDTPNMFWRSRYGSRGESFEKVGLTIHILFSCLKKSWDIQEFDHVVLAFDRKSWRKDVYAPYKANRYVNLSEEDVEANRVFFEAFDSVKNYFQEKTNCSVLEHDGLEADDIISWFIQQHPQDKHTIVSSDADFDQLLADNVSIYDGIDDTITTKSGVFDYRRKQLTDKKTGKLKVPPDPEWSLFEKSIRGCTSDHIFSAYPGVRLKSTKSKTGLLEAFADKGKQGFAWSSVMLQKWVDHNGIEHRVIDDYKRNLSLVDLKNGQPEFIMLLLNDVIQKCQNPKKIPMIGFHFLKFCGKYQLTRLSEQSKAFVQFLSKSYPA